MHLMLMSRLNTLAFQLTSIARLFIAWEAIAPEPILAIHARLYAAV